MSQNIQHNEQSLQSYQEVGTKKLAQLQDLSFYDKLRYLLTINVQNFPKYFKYLASGHGFVFIDAPASLAQLSQTVEEIFGVDLIRFNALAKQMNMKVKESINKQSQQRRVIYKCKQKIINLEQVNHSIVEEGQESSEEPNENDLDQFPKDEDVENVIRAKQQKGKRNLMKPNIILNRVHSEGSVPLVQSRKSLEDISLQVKLYEQDLFATSQPIRQPINFKKQAVQNISNNCVKSDYIDSSSMADRSKFYKQNYEKCSKLIDTTIMELLTAHKSNVIDQRADGLLQKITEIYDMLSDNIENINSTAKFLARREMHPSSITNSIVKKEVLEEVGSIGFKPLNQDN